MEEVREPHSFELLGTLAELWIAAVAHAAVQSKYPIKTHGVMIQQIHLVGSG